MNREGELHHWDDLPDSTLPKNARHAYAKLVENLKIKHVRVC